MRQIVILNLHPQKKQKQKQTPGFKDRQVRKDKPRHSATTCHKGKVKGYSSNKR